MHEFFDLSKKCYNNYCYCPCNCHLKKIIEDSIILKKNNKIIF